MAVRVGTLLRPSLLPLCRIGKAGSLCGCCNDGCDGRHPYFIGETPALVSIASDLMHRKGSKKFEQWELAESLKLMGLRPGDRIAVIGDGFDAYYARLADSRIVVEIPRGDAGKTWELAADTQTAVLEMLKRYGVKCIATESLPATIPANNWQRLGATRWHARMIGEK